MTQKKTPGRAPPKRKKRVPYTPKLAERICERLAEGTPWTQIAGTRGMPSQSALYAWQKRHPEFAEAVEIARMSVADGLSDSALEVAHAATKDTVQQDRLLVNTLMKQSERADRKWGGGRKGVEPQRPEKRVVFYVRQFERVTGEDGRTYLREIPILPSKEQGQ